jgi:hypothetical protein
MNTLTPDESYSFSVNNPIELNSRFNFTIAAGSKSILPGGSLIPG